MNLRCLLLGHQPGWRLLHDEAVISRCLNCGKLIEYSYETWRQGNNQKAREQYEKTRADNSRRSNELSARTVHELDKKGLSGTQSGNISAPVHTKSVTVCPGVRHERLNTNMGAAKARVPRAKRSRHIHSKIRPGKKVGGVDAS